MQNKLFFTIIMISLILYSKASAEQCQIQFDVSDQLSGACSTFYGPGTITTQETYKTEEAAIELYDTLYSMCYYPCPVEGYYTPRSFDGNCVSGGYGCKVPIPSCPSRGVSTTVRVCLDGTYSVSFYTCSGSTEVASGQWDVICEPTLIKLSSFATTPRAGRVMLAWSTASEIDNAGFNLYRSETENGQYIKINTSLIPAEGSSTQGASYDFTDTNVQNRKTYYYKLEDIDFNGKSTMHGPVSAMPRMIYGVGK